MDVTIQKDFLVNLVAKTQSVVEKRNTMQVLSHILLEAEDNKLRVFATDLSVSFNDEKEASVKVAGKAAVNARNLFEIIKDLPNEPIRLVKQENNWLKISQEKALFNIVGINPDEYPVFSKYATKDFLVIESKLLKEMIEKTIYSVATDETRYHLNGIYFEKQIQGEEVSYRMVATDGYRLSLIDRKATAVGPYLTNGTQSIIIPKKGLHELGKLLESADERVEIAVEGSQFVVRLGSAILMIRLIEGKYPNYQKLIPKNLKKKILVNRENLLNSIKRVSLLSNSESKGVNLVFSNGKMQISSQSPELGDANEEIEVAYDGEHLNFLFNARFVLEALASMNDEMVQIEVNDQQGTPGLVHPYKDSLHTCVVMPMRD
ncbi:MAG: DNA polymerase III subunit beta [Bdellovibrionales bacterium]|nr:DNA polymerase III subunit beta [Bdellovibrionales bacterium]